jgi:hypothetical protein
MTMSKCVHIIDVANLLISSHRCNLGFIFACVMSHRLIDYKMRTGNRQNDWQLVSQKIAQ